MRKRRCEEKREITVALAGNPNVGKSTLFNSLTGMRVHTGNWAGKTVGCAAGFFETDKYRVRLVDIPGTYSLFSHSEEERIARDYISFGKSDITVVVCDSTALEQNLNLALQITEIGGRCVLALNFSDEARKKGIEVDSQRLSEILSIPVVKVVAHKKKSLDALKSLICSLYEAGDISSPRSPVYIEPIERAAGEISSVIRDTGRDGALSRWLGLRLMDADGDFFDELLSDFSREERERAEEGAARAAKILGESGISREELSDIIVERLVEDAADIAKEVTLRKGKDERDRRIDRILTGRFTAYPFMLVLLFLVFWITLSLANIPSELLSRLFVFLEGILTEVCARIGVPDVLHGALVLGVFRTLGQVVSVMLPPMVIFFPLFALLEDSGYLPRIAYNLDRPFACAGACGKQALTMCMGLGCNAVGIVGCRIIDSRRERSLAAVTNSLVPCNGRLPMMITLISVFYLFLMPRANGALTALTLMGFIVLGVAMTFLSTAILSKTLLRGERSSFIIELPPYRRPRFISVTLHSLKDKCLSVLLRAISVAAPMGLIIWIMANVYIGGESLIAAVADFLLPFGRLMGLDGVILLAFILGIPANEIVVPLIIMIYSASGAIGADMGVEAVSAVFANAGWTPVTAICATVFSLFHWPCSTSLLTVYRETKSKGLTAIAFILPTVIGILLCIFINFASKLFV